MSLSVLNQNRNLNCRLVFFRSYRLSRFSQVVVSFGGNVVCWSYSLVGPVGMSCNSEGVDLLDILWWTPFFDFRVTIYMLTEMSLSNTVTLTGLSLWGERSILIVFINTPIHNLFKSPLAHFFRIPSL